MIKGILLFVPLLFLSCSGEEKSKIPYYTTPDFTPHFLTDTQAEKLIQHRVEDFNLLNQEGIRFSSKALNGKIYITNFIFTKCGKICPELTAQMKRIEKAYRLNPEVQLISMTVTPWIDDVKTLQAFGKKHQISAHNWQLLTGPKEQIYHLARKSFFAEESLGFNKDASEFLHTEHLILVDQKGRIRGIYNGTLPFEAIQCIEDVKILLNEI